MPRSHLLPRLAAGAFLASWGACSFAATAGVPAPGKVGTAEVRPAAPAAFREIKWDELVPKGWDPYKDVKNGGTAALSDRDPRALDLLRDLRAIWDMAPTVDALDGVAIRLPGYVVPLDEVKGELKEFLLVPYFGACIHTPPPPANQIVLVVAPKGVKFRAMDTVWVSGRLQASRNDSAMGASGYRVEASAVEAYVAPARP